MTFARATPQRITAGLPIRVLIVDDSVVIRRVVSQVLEQDPALEVMGVASNGAIALERIPQLNPEVVTLDIEMPEMDGIETLRRIRKAYPKLCVIMFSTLTERGGHHTLEALALGANDYVTKAANVGSLDQSMDRLRNELVPKIKQFFTLEPPAIPAPRVATPLKAPTRLPSLATKREVVAIGVSTGGPNALAEIFPRFPADFPCPIVVVQHMPPLFTRMLAERLDKQSPLAVEEASEGVRLQAGKALIAPGDFHMTVSRNNGEMVVRLNQEPHENSCRPAVDVLFRSLAESYGPRVLAVVLTGMGHDGLRGSQELKAKGAYLVAQDKASSVVWGMPGYVVEAGLADAVKDLGAIVPEILKQVR